MKPNAQEAEKALNHALQARAISTLVADLIVSGLVADLIVDNPGRLYDHQLQDLSYVTAAIGSLLGEVIDVLDRVRDDAAMEPDA